MRIGIVNDMAIAREALRRVVLSVPGYQIAWTAHDGIEAVELNREDRPDLILMDLVMPRMSGADATRQIMAEAPCPILVVTATVSGHMNKVYEAMGFGALDAVDTPTVGPRGAISGESTMLDKIATIRKLIGPLRNNAGPAPPARADARSSRVDLVVIGASTGGPNALAAVLSGLPKSCPACVVMVQHVDAAFAGGMTRWLGEGCGHRVDLVVEGEIPSPGRWLLAGTNDHLVMNAGGRLTYSVEPRNLSFRPSVDVFFSSAGAHWPDPGVAVLLTGMLRDGAEGLLKLRRLKWHTVAQDEATSVIWGMPGAAVEIGAAVQVLPLSEIAGAVVGKLGSKT